MYLRLNFRWKSKASNLRQPKLFAFYKEKCSNNFSIRKCYLLKGYLRYKTITYQNVPSKAQIKNFFISQKNYVPFSRYSSFCIFNHPMIYQISVVTMSISTWDKVHFWIYLLNHKLEVTKLGQLIDISTYNNFQ